MREINPSIKQPFLIDRVVATILVLTWAIAIVSPQHFFPISTFYQELGLAAGVLLSGGLLAWSRKYSLGLSIPWAALPFFGILGLGLLDLLLRKSTYPDAMIWPLGSLVVAAMAAVIAAQWVQRSMAEALMGFWAWAFVLGALGTVLSMWAQLFFPGMGSFWLFPRSPLQAPMGNIGQRNQATLILGFGLLGLAYLAARPGASQSRSGQAFGLLCLLGFTSGIALSQSRIGLAFLAVVTICGGMMLSRPHRRWLGALLGLASGAAAYGLLQWIIYTGFGLGQLFPSGLQRLADRGLGQRLGLWDVAWTVFQSHPLLGVGLGNFVQSDYSLSLRQTSPLFANNAHNLFAQLAAETGAAGLFLALLPGIISTTKAWRNWAGNGIQTWENWQILATGVCLIVLGYSLTEYPLWYVLYAVPFATCWAVLDVPAWVARPSRGLRWLFGAASVAALMYCAWAARTYVGIAKASADIFLPAATDSQSPIQKAVSTGQIFHCPGFSPYVDAMVFMRMSADHFMLPDKITLGERVVTTYANPQLIAKLATLYGLAHDPLRAATTFARLCAYFPDNCGQATNNVRALQRQNPDYFNPVADRFFSMPQSRIKAQNIDALRPWDGHHKGTIVTIDPTKTWFGFDLAGYASGLNQLGMKSGTFLAAPSDDRHLGKDSTH